MTRFVAVLFVVAVACSSKIANPLRCVASQACYDCLQTSCAPELRNAESACMELLDCRQRSCKDTNCSLRATAACDTANMPLTACEKALCAVCPGTPSSTD